VSCELNLEFKWRRVEGHTHYLRILKVMVGSKGLAQMNFLVIKRDLRKTMDRPMDRSDSSEQPFPDFQSVLFNRQALIAECTGYVVFVAYLH